MQGTRQSAPDSFDDDLYETWFDDGSPNDISVHGPGENVDITKPSETLRVQQREKLFVAGSSDTKVSKRNEEQADVGMRENDDEVMVGQQQVQDYTVITDDLKLNEERETEVAAPDGNLDDEKHEILSDEDYLAEKRDGNAPTISYEKGKTTVFDLDDVSSMDSFPAIVDVDPDSDAEKSA